MKPEYDFSKAVRHPYVKKEKKAVTIRLENEVIKYFKAMSSETGIPYQNLINLYLRDCADQSRKLSFFWNPKSKSQSAE